MGVFRFAIVLLFKYGIILERLSDSLVRCSSKMNRVKSIARWLVLPFGSLKVFVIVVLLFLLSRVADVGSTYWVLSQWGFDFSEEKHPFTRMLFNLIGFWGDAAVNLFLSFILILLSACFFYLLRENHTRLAKVAPVATLLSISLISFFVAMGNLVFPRY